MTTEVDTTPTAAASTSSASFLHLAGSKLRNRLGGQLNESSAVGASAFAKAQLEKLGWKEGEGLGKRRQGMSSHIRVVKRAEGLGLGESTLDPALQQAVLGNGDWWKHSVGDTLAKLASKNKSNKKKSKKDKGKEKTKPTKKIYTDEELFEATGGARFGMRAQTQQHGKWKRAESNISEQEELEAKSKVEWDGMKAPVVVLKEKASDINNDKAADESSSSKNKTKKRKEASDEEKESPSAVKEEEKAERKRQKKEKKRRRKEESESEPSSKKSKKGSKKEKVSKD